MLASAFPRKEADAFTDYYSTELFDLSDSFQPSLALPLDYTDYSNFQAAGWNDSEVHPQKLTPTNPIWLEKRA